MADYEPLLCHPLSRKGSPVYVHVSHARSLFFTKWNEALLIFVGFDNLSLSVNVLSKPHRFFRVLNPAYKWIVPVSTLHLREFPCAREDLIPPMWFLQIWGTYVSVSLQFVAGSREHFVSASCASLVPSHHRVRRLVWNSWVIFDVGCFSDH